MKNLIYFLVVLLYLDSLEVIGQCTNTTNIYSFNYGGHIYEVVKERTNWRNAAKCAIERGGYLAEINDSLEQDSIFYHVINKANIIMTNTQNIFGTSAIWIGGTDTLKEGTWIWDGNNDGVGIQFWNGGPTGMPVNGSYTKWGTSPAEPDNSGGQQHLCLTIDSRRVNYGKWNDIKSNDNIYYLIERDLTSGNSTNFLESKFKIFPNPAKDYLTISHSNSEKFVAIEIYNLTGHQQLRFNNFDNNNDISLNISALNPGLYAIKIQLINGRKETLKFAKLYN